MAHVLYRRWRPKTFGDVAGQAHITKTLRKAIISDRVAHAYLFTGPRGVGKTSTARIVAKSLNCLERRDGEPDNACANCTAADSERLLDLVEIDAASNRGIDDIRNLRESVRFQPVEGSWKVYIIDEVHMLTEGAFNALLKTLEEPPPKVVMILATTDVHKIPQTVVSRCQRYDFHRISEETLVKRLTLLCDREEAKFEANALNLIASIAAGSLRDAENMLEQVVLGAFTKEGDATEITSKHVTEMLGLGDIATIAKLVRAVLESDARTSFRLLSAELARGISAQSLHKGMVEVLRSVLLVSTGVREEGVMDAEVVEVASLVKEQRAKRQLLRMLEVMNSIRFTNSQLASMPLELAIFGLCLPYESANVPVSEPPVRRAAPAPPTSQPPSQRTATVRRSPRPSPGAPASPNTVHEETQRRRLSDALWRRQRRVLGSVLLNVEFKAPQNGVLYLKFLDDGVYKKFMEEMKESSAQADFRSAIDEVFTPGIKLKAFRATEQTGKQEAPQTELHGSPTVRAAMQLGATVAESKPEGSGN